MTKGRDFEAEQKENTTPAPQCAISQEFRTYVMETTKMSQKIDKTLEVIAEMRKDTQNLQALTFIAQAIENVTRPGGRGNNIEIRKRGLAIFSGNSLYVFAIIVLSVALLVKELGASPAKLDVGVNGIQFRTEGHPEPTPSQSQPQH